MSDFIWRPLRRGFSICAIAVVVSALAAPGALARAGDPDPSFGVNGRVVADVVPATNALATSVAIDTQGRIVVGGYLPRPMWSLPVVARFNPDGSLDQSFGNGGVVRPDWGVGPVEGIAIDAAGRIVLGGSRELIEPLPGPSTVTGYDIAVARLLDNGEPDRSFADDGLLALDGGGKISDFGSDLTLDARGRILLSGTTNSGSYGRQIAAVRVTESGLPDPSFGGDGIVSVEGGEGEAIAIDAQGRIAVAGSAATIGQRRFAVVRVDASGNLDTSFGANGWALLDFGVGSAGEVAADVVIDALGRLVLVGRSGFGRAGPALAGRLLPDGAPDPSFDGDGKLSLALPGPAEAAGVAIDPGGRILAVGTLSTGDAEEAFLARLDSDGRLDSSFGAAGVVRESFSARLARAAAVTVDSAGRYLIAGGATGGGVKGLALARFLSSDQQQVPVATPRCRGRRATVVGTAGRDRLRGTRGRDVIVALGGNDRIRSFGGKDLICAGKGRDLVRAGAGNDRVFGGPGNDRLLGGPGRDQLRGGPGRDVMR